MQMLLLGLELAVAKYMPVHNTLVAQYTLLRQYTLLKQYKLLP